MLLSILVVSRTPQLINNMLASIANATELTFSQVEILCSWNGGPNAADKIVNNSGYQFSIAQMTPYHFASNINLLAKHSKGKLLLIINDDIVLDKNSIDHSINCLYSEDNVGLVGARLRYDNDKVQHIGIQFDKSNYPYHKLENLIHDKDYQTTEISTPVPAVTGALMLIKKDVFMRSMFNEMYNVCGEDIELCLNLRDQFNLFIYLCHDFTAIHKSSATRRFHNQYGNNIKDLQMMQACRSSFLSKADASQLLVELNDSQSEAEYLIQIHYKKKYFKRLIKKSLRFFKRISHYIFTLIPSE